jgi:hypothetical protein
VAAVEIHRGDVEIRAMSGLSTTAAAAVERCALGIRGRPAATSSLRRAVAQRRPAALTAFRRWPVAPRAVATTPADPDVRLALCLFPLLCRAPRPFDSTICGSGSEHFPFSLLFLSQVAGRFTLESNSELQVRLHSNY